MKENIKDRSDGELYLLVYNTEELWRLRHNPKFFEEIDGRYEYTTKQLEVLKEALEGDYGS